MHKLKPCQPSIQNAITVLENEKQCVLRQIQMGGCDRDCIKCDLVMKDSEILEGYDTAIAVLRRAQPANEPLTCEGCKNDGEYENEIEYGYPSPCTRCKRRVSDNYRRPPERSENDATD